jgi:hypothetical protein
LLSCWKNLGKMVAMICFRARWTLTVVLFCSFALAHKPFFPEGAGPFAISNPSVSQAHYLNLPAGQSHSFMVPALEYKVPIQLLVLDNEQGRALDFDLVWICAGQAVQLQKVDTPFYESFSKLNHRYRIVDALGPTTEACEARVSERNGAAGPYTFAIGSEEKFSIGDLFGLAGLGARLKAWQEKGESKE